MTMEEVRIIETLVMNKGSYIIYGGVFGTGSLFRQNDTRPYVSVPRKVIKNLHKHEGLLTLRIVCEIDGYEGTRWHRNIYEVYKPALSNFECFKELAIQHAVGAV